MPYVLGIDLGPERTTAAVCRLTGAAPDAGGWGEPEVVPLGAGTADVASRLRLLPDRSVQAGDDGPAAMGRPVDGFAGRAGDDVPMIVGDERVGGHTLLAGLAMWVVQRVQAWEGGPAERLVVCHPAGWGPYRTQVLRRSLQRAGFDAVTLLPAPVAAAQAHPDLPAGTGSTVAVLDLGGGEVSVLRRAAGGGYELLRHADTGVGGDADGYPGGLAPLLDDALVDLVSGRLQLRLDELDPADPAVRDGVTRLRADCAGARRRLHTGGETDVAVELPDLHTRVTVTRAEFEEAARPLLATAADALVRSLHSCGLAQEGGAADLAAVVLAGEAARTPLAQRIVAAALPGRLAVADAPEATVARGAAAAGLLAAAPDQPAGTVAGVLTGDRIYRAGGQGVDRYDSDGRTDHDLADDGVAVPAGRADLADPPPRPPVRISPLDVPQRRPGRHLPGRPGIALFVALILIGVVTLGVALYLAIAL